MIKISQKHILDHVENYIHITSKIVNSFSPKS
jgi:hypothetical protein